MLKGKSVLLGVTGGIAAYKMAGVCSRLIKLHADTDVIMTENACHFITPITFESLTSHKCMTDTFDRNFQFDIKHISMAQKADVLLIAPATANVIGKLANGIADDMLTTTVMACKKAKKFIVPAMNTNMYENPIVQDNMKKLQNYGYEIIEASSGRLACGTVGKGKMPEPKDLYKYIERECKYEKDLVGKKVVVTAGATQEKIDPVRYITNHSTGKMGYAIAKVAMERGADVTLISGITSLEKVPFVNTIDVVSAEDMFNAVVENYDNADIVIKSAAVADFTPENVFDEKVKKSSGNMDTIKLKPTKDIIKYLGEHKENQFLCGFSMETENMVENSRDKLTRKNLDMIVANNVKVKGAGFGTDTNVVTIITKDNEETLPIMTKEEVAEKLLDRIVEKIQ